MGIFECPREVSVEFFITTFATPNKCALLLNHDHVDIPVISDKHTRLMIINYAKNFVNKELEHFIKLFLT